MSGYLLAGRCPAGIQKHRRFKHSTSDGVWRLLQPPEWRAMSIGSNRPRFILLLLPTSEAPLCEKVFSWLHCLGRVSFKKPPSVRGEGGQGLFIVLAGDFQPFAPRRPSVARFAACGSRCAPGLAGAPFPFLSGPAFPSRIHPLPGGYGPLQRGTGR